MKKLYGRETDCLVRRKKFEERIWKRDETFANYYHEKTILANQVPINANEMMSYLIRGIPNKNLRNQVRLQKFATDIEMLEAMEDISLPSPCKSEVKKGGRSQDANAKGEGTTHQRAGKQEAVEQKMQRGATTVKKRDILHQDVSRNGRKEPVIYAVRWGIK